ncbi:hypothetical protein NECAME_02762 [Necator americanus]|uniref:Large ribosomal subunit protein uL15m n=1 Tax=Necator americanus TaxID=51031 RepID=W2TAM7_NECAM|nr:hypothetical protein NECAME_02762 [Necator americanus]ETN78898.1 hypothetical protein NECAME_02762 [Necator americanus]
MAQGVKSAAERALRIVEKSSRVRIQDLRDNVGARTSGRQVNKRANQAGHTRGALQHAAKPPLGWIWGDFFHPWHRRFPGEEHFNADVNVRREYIPLSLIELSRLIDLGWVDPSRPIDVAALCATRKFNIKPKLRQCGFDLTAEGADVFTHKVDIEVQYASQTAISAVERAGGRIRVAYYDPDSLQAAVDPRAWFKSGTPVPARKAPPPSLLEYYTSAFNRGYLAEAAELVNARQRLGLVMGYKLADEEVQLEDKGPTQVFYGIPPGAVVSLADKKVFVPTNPVVKNYYQKSFVADKQYP